MHKLHTADMATMNAVASYNSFHNGCFFAADAVTAVMVFSLCGYLEILNGVWKVCCSMVQRQRWPVSCPVPSAIAINFPCEAPFYQRLAHVVKVAAGNLSTVAATFPTTALTMTLSTLWLLHLFLKRKSYIQKHRTLIITSIRLSVPLVVLLLVLLCALFPGRCQVQVLLEVENVLLKVVGCRLLTMFNQVRWDLHTRLLLAETLLMLLACGLASAGRHHPASSNLAYVAARLHPLRLLLVDLVLGFLATVVVAAVEWYFVRPAFLKRQRQQMQQHELTPAGSHPPPVLYLDRIPHPQAHDSSPLYTSSRQSAIVSVKVRFTEATDHAAQQQIRQELAVISHSLAQESIPNLIAAETTIVAGCLHLIMRLIYRQPTADDPTATQATNADHQRLQTGAGHWDPGSQSDYSMHPAATQLLPRIHNMVRQLQFSFSTPTPPSRSNSARQLPPIAGNRDNAVRDDALRPAPTAPPSPSRSLSLQTRSLGMQQVYDSPMQMPVVTAGSRHSTSIRHSSDSSSPASDVSHGIRHSHHDSQHGFMCMLESSRSGRQSLDGSRLSFEQAALDSPRTISPGRSPRHSSDGSQHAAQMLSSDRRAMTDSHATTAQVHKANSPQPVLSDSHALSNPTVRGPTLSTLRRALHDRHATPSAPFAAHQPEPSRHAVSPATLRAHSGPPPQPVSAESSQLTRAPTAAHGTLSITSAVIDTSNRLLHFTDIRDQTGPSLPASPSYRATTRNSPPGTGTGKNSPTASSTPSAPEEHAACHPRWPSAVLTAEPPCAAIDLIHGPAATFSLRFVTHRPAASSSCPEAEASDQPPATAPTASYPARDAYGAHVEDTTGQEFPMSLGSPPPALRHVRRPSPPQTMEPPDDSARTSHGLLHASPTHTHGALPFAPSAPPTHPTKLRVVASQSGRLLVDEVHHIIPHVLAPNKQVAVIPLTVLQPMPGILVCHVIDVTNYSHADSALQPATAMAQIAAAAASTHLYEQPILLASVCMPVMPPAAADELCQLYETMKQQAARESSASTLSDVTKAGRPSRDYPSGPECDSGVALPQTLHHESDNLGSIRRGSRGSSVSDSANHAELLHNSAPPSRPSSADQDDASSALLPASDLKALTHWCQFSQDLSVLLAPGAEILGRIAEPSHVESMAQGLMVGPAVDGMPGSMAEWEAMLYHMVDYLGKQGACHALVALLKAAETHRQLVIRGVSGAPVCAEAATDALIASYRPAQPAPEATNLPSTARRSADSQRLLEEPARTSKDIARSPSDSVLQRAEIDHPVPNPIQMNVGQPSTAVLHSYPINQSMQASRPNDHRDFHEWRLQSLSWVRNYISLPARLVVLCIQSYWLMTRGADLPITPLKVLLLLLPLCTGLPPCDILWRLSFSRLDLVQYTALSLVLGHVSSCVQMWYLAYTVSGVSMPPAVCMLLCAVYMLWQGVLMAAVEQLGTGWQLLLAPTDAACAYAVVVRVLKGGRGMGFLAAVLIPATNVVVSCICESRWRTAWRGRNVTPQPVRRSHDDSAKQH